jgi:hypothetical protein
MGWWIDGVPEHEGYAAQRVSADAVAVAAASPEVGPDGALYTSTRSTATHPLVTGWRAACDCGWWSEQLHARRAGDDYDAPPEVEDACLAEWRSHVAPMVAIRDVEVAAETAREATAALTAAVHHAHVLGLSWADIGRAAGISRQAARERWGVH